MSIPYDPLEELLEEGVRCMIEEQWVDPDDFEDPELHTALHNAVNAYDDYLSAVKEAMQVADEIYRQRTDTE